MSRSRGVLVTDLLESDLEWWPHPTVPHAVRVRWPANVPFTVYWGDGTSQHVGGAVIVAHVYDTTGTWDVVCVADASREYTTAARVTIRGFTVPAAPTASVAGNRVTLTCPEVPDPVLWRVDWGDGAASDHASGTAEHSYAWDFGSPEVTVTDVPSGRLVRFTGPTIGPCPDPVPPPAPVRGFFLEYVATGSDYRRIRLRGGGIPPGQTVTWYPYTCAWYREVVADRDGDIRDEVDWPKGINWDFDDSWRSFTVISHDGTRFHVPYHGPLLEAGTPTVVYNIHVDGDPQKVRLSARPAMLGWHTVDFGDGTSTRVRAEKLPLDVPHRYTGAGPYDVTITLPDGRTTKGQVKGAFPCAPCFNPNYPGSCTVTWNFTGNGICPRCGDAASGPFAPVIVDNGHHPPHQIHRPDNRTGWHVAYGYSLPVGTHDFRYATFGRPVSSSVVDIARASPVRDMSDEVRLVQVDGAEPANLAVRFVPVTTWDGGYSGEFVVSNEDTEAHQWVVEFALSDPAVLREVWGAGSPRFEEVGGGRWRIWCGTPIPGFTDARVGARVEPPGNPTRYPHDLHAEPHQQETGE